MTDQEIVDELNKMYGVLGAYNDFCILIGESSETNGAAIKFNLCKRYIDSTKGSVEQALEIDAYTQKYPGKFFWATYQTLQEVPFFDIQSRAVAIAQVNVRHDDVELLWHKHRGILVTTYTKFYNVPAKPVEVVEPLRPLKEYDFLPPPSPEFQASVSRWTADMDNDWDW